MNSFPATYLQFSLQTCSLFFTFLRPCEADLHRLFLQVAFPGLTGFNEEIGWETETGGQRAKRGCVPADFPMPGHSWRGCCSRWGWALGGHWARPQSHSPCLAALPGSYTSRLVPVPATPLIPWGLGVVTDSLLLLLARASPCPVLSTSPGCTSVNSHFIQVVCSTPPFEAACVFSQDSDCPSLLVFLFLLCLPPP